jgi:ketosteroid isomerase-like protein
VAAVDDVRRTLHAYCRLLDERDLDELMRRVYLPDATDDRKRGTPLRGHDEIRGYFAKAFEQVASTTHLLSNIDVEISGDGTRATSYSRVTAYHWTFGGEPVREADFVVLGSYDDELVRTDDGWRIDHRVVGALGQAGLSQGTLPPMFAGFGGAQAAPAS